MEDFFIVEDLIESYVCHLFLSLFAKLRKPDRLNIPKIKTPKHLCENLKSKPSKRRLHLKPFQFALANRDHLNSNSGTSDLSALLDPSSNLSIDNLDTTDELPACRAHVPGCGFDSVTGRDRLDQFQKRVRGKPAPTVGKVKASSQVGFWAS